MTARIADVVVVGAGIVGAACARALARQGLGVTVVDSRPPGSGTTGAGMGHILVMDDSPAQTALCRYSQQLWDELAVELPADCEFERCGTVWVAEEEEETALVLQKHETFERIGIHSEILDDRELYEAAPNLRGELAGGLLVPGESVIYPPCAARWLLEESQRFGAKVKCDATVTELSGKQVRFDDDETIASAYTVNAAGAWAAKLTPGLPIRLRKGHLVITDRYPGFLRHQLLELGYLKSVHGGEMESVAFVVQPRKTGQILIGSCRQFDAETPQVDHGILRQMIRRALHFMPALVTASATRVWTGFRAATPDSLPLIGPHPVIPGLLLATGHEGLGITTSTGTGELIAAHVMGKKPQIDATPYLPDRLVDHK